MAVDDQIRSLQTINTISPDRYQDSRYNNYFNFRVCEIENGSG